MFLKCLKRIFGVFSCISALISLDLALTKYYEQLELEQRFDSFYYYYHNGDELSANDFVFLFDEGYCDIEQSISFCEKGSFFRTARGIGSGDAYESFIAAYGPPVYQGTVEDDINPFARWVNFANQNDHYAESIYKGYPYILYRDENYLLCFVFDKDTDKACGYSLQNLNN